jgi:WhiB family transcriptional regulator, redox-sensing transcriptional regulator
VNSAWNLGGYRDWYADAACRDRGHRLWFTSHGRFARAAIAVCDSCPVQCECLRLALSHPELEGIWGGTDAEDRARIRARGYLREPSALHDGETKATTFLPDAS